MLSIEKFLYYDFEYCLTESWLLAFVWFKLQLIRRWLYTTYMYMAYFCQCGTLFNIT